MTSLKSSGFTAQDLDLLSDFQVTDDHPPPTESSEVITGATMDHSSGHELISGNLMDDDLGPDDMMSSEDDRLFEVAADMDFTEDELPNPTLPPMPPLIPHLPRSSVSTVLSTPSMTVTSNPSQLSSPPITSMPSTSIFVGQNTYSKQMPVVVPSTQSHQSLSEFCTNIRPPVIPGVTGKINPVNITLNSQTAAKAINLSNMTIQRSNFSEMRPITTNLCSTALPITVKKVASSGVPIHIQTSTVSGQTPQNTYKLIIPSGQQQSVGQQPQQIFIQSPAGLTLQSSSSVAKPQVSNVTSNAGGQQIVFLSPVKPGTSTATSTGNRTQLKTIAPAPVTAGATITTTTTQPNLRLVSSKDGQVLKGTGGQPLQVIRLVSSIAGQKTTTNTLRTIAPSPGKTVSLIPSGKNVTGTSSGTNTQVLTGAAATQFLQTTRGAGGTIGGSSPQVIMLPANLLSQAGLTLNNKGQLTQTTNQGIKIHVQDSKRPFVPIAPSPSTPSSHIHPSSKEILQGLNVATNKVFLHPGSLNGVQVKRESVESSGDSKRKPCNCSKSQCLKLYCDCFANGEFCKNCNCINCFNNLDHENDRQKAIRQCLERNPHAFHPKIGKGRMTGDVTERRHTKGCNCRRSGCLKNYCECFEAKINCTELCKCCGCKNFEDSYERKSLQLMSLADAAELRSSQQTAASKILWGSDYTPKLPVSLTSRQRVGSTCSFITQEVIDATSQCLMATAEDAEKRGLDDDSTEKELIMEFGRCLKQIIEAANQAKA